MKIINNIYTCVAVAGLLLSSCSEDDLTGHSTVTPSENVSVEIVAPSSIPNLSHGDGDLVYTFDINLTRPQIVDIKVYVTTDGTAEEDHDYSLSAHSVTIPAFSTAGGTIALTFHGNELRYDEKTFSVKIGDERTGNASITPVSISATLAKTPDCILFPDVSTLLGDYDEATNDGVQPTAGVVSIIEYPDAGAGGLQIQNFGFSDPWWCGHPDVTLDLIFNECDQVLTFPTGDEQEPGNLDDICGPGGFGQPTVTLQGPISLDPNTGIISFSAEVTVAAGSFGVVEYTYTPQ